MHVSKVYFCDSVFLENSIMVYSAIWRKHPVFKNNDQLSSRNKQDLFLICGAVRDLVPSAQFKKREKHAWRRVNFSKVAEPATLLKLTLLHGHFSRFLNCTNGMKSRDAPHFFFTIFRVKIPKHVKHPTFSDWISHLFISKMEFFILSIYLFFYLFL